jgi:hypothetical protein
VAPFVLTGTVDERGFYLRERHSLWRGTIAPDEDPGADPSVHTLDIADGDADRLLAHGDFSVVPALDGGGRGGAVVPATAGVRARAGAGRRPVLRRVRDGAHRPGVAVGRWRPASAALRLARARGQ